jgi:hypothetical protein
MKPTNLKDFTRQRYGDLAESNMSCCAIAAPPDMSSHMGYAAQEMDADPMSRNIGRACGNPQAVAAIRPGAGVVGLGCGAGPFRTMLHRIKNLGERIKADYLATLGEALSRRDREIKEEHVLNSTAHENEYYLRAKMLEDQRVHFARTF